MSVAVAAVVGVAVDAVALALTLPSGYSLDGAVGALAGYALLLVLWALIGAALALLLRATTGPIVVLLVWPLLVEPLLFVLLSSDRLKALNPLARYLPFQAGRELAVPGIVVGSRGARAPDAAAGRSGLHRVHRRPRRTRLAGVRAPRRVSRPRCDHGFPSICDPRGPSGTRGLAPSSRQGEDESPARGADHGRDQTCRRADRALGCAAYGAASRQSGDRRARRRRAEDAHLRPDRPLPGLSKTRMALALVGVLYVVSPVDFMPEILLGVLGLGDDALVAAWVAGAVLAETDAFLRWEAERRRVVVGQVIR